MRLNHSHCPCMMLALSGELLSSYAMRLKPHFKMSIARRLCANLPTSRGLSLQPLRSTKASIQAFTCIHPSIHPSIHPITNPKKQASVYLIEAVLQFVSIYRFWNYCIATSTSELSPSHSTYYLSTFPFSLQVS